MPGSGNYNERSHEREKERQSVVGDGSRDETEKAIGERQRKKSDDADVPAREYNGPLLRARYPRTMPAPGFS